MYCPSLTNRQSHIEDTNLSLHKTYNISKMAYALKQGIQAKLAAAARPHIKYLVLSSVERRPFVIPNVSPCSSSVAKTVASDIKA